MDTEKLNEILLDKCGKIADLVLKDQDVDPTALYDEDLIKVRAAWRQYLRRLGVTWKWDSWRCGSVADAPEGHQALADFVVDRGVTTLFIPNDLAEKMLVLGYAPDPSKKSRVGNPEGRKEPIMRASRNKTQYVGLKTVTSSEDGRRIVFVFNNAESLYYSVATSKWFHSNTDKEMGESHFGNISWGEPLYLPPPAAPGSRWKDFKPGCDGFYEQIAQIATEGWVKSYFTILARWTKHYVKRNLRESDREISKRAVKRINRLDVLTGENSMAIENLAKNNYIQKMPIDTVCNVAFAGDTILDFKAFRERGMDAWFCKHVGERAATEYVIADHVQGRVDERAADFGVWLPQYHAYCRDGMGDIWQHVWEKYRFAMMHEWRVTNALQRFKELTGRGYNAKKIMDYVFHILPMQGICHSMVNQNFDCIVTLADYAKMQSEMCGGNYDRYPKGLKMSHDIAARNYRVKQSQAFADKFAAMCNEIKYLELADKEYSVVIPKEVNEIVNEGAALNHCVASYVSGVVDRTYSIVFLRKTDEIEKPLVTVQVSADGKQVMQARGHSNRDLTEAEEKFLNKYRDHLDPSRQKTLWNVAEDLAINPMVAGAA